MRRLLGFLILLVLAVWAGLSIKSDPGYAMFAYHSTTVEMPFWFFILVWLVSSVVLYGIAQVLKLVFGVKGRVSLWNRKRLFRRGLNKTGQGLIALAEGHWQQAEKLLITGAKTSQAPLINYLAAAQAAQKQEAYQKRDDYLQDAHASTPDAEIAIGLTQAQLQLDRRQYEQALATLRHLRQLAPHHNYVLRLLAKLYEKLGDWDSLVKLFPELKHNKVLKSEKYQALRARVYNEQLLAAVNGKSQLSAEHVWRDLPRDLQRHPQLVYGYATFLLAQKREAQAESLLRETLNKHWDKQLLSLYAEIDIDSTKQLSTAEQWLQSRPNDAELLVCLAAICERQQLWGKARSYLETSLSVKPQAITYRQLARLLEKLGEQEQALKYYKEGLQAL